MTEHTQDFLTSTGKHRAWLGEHLNDAHLARPQERRLERTVPLNAQHSNLPHTSRPQTVPPGQLVPPNARHAAITKRLATFPNYKSWAEKARSGWKDKPE